mgnify:CR=1 FL=1
MLIHRLLVDEFLLLLQERHHSILIGKSNGLIGRPSLPSDTIVMDAEPACDGWLSLVRVEAGSTNFFHERLPLHDHPIQNGFLLQLVLIQQTIILRNQQLRIIIVSESAVRGTTKNLTPMQLNIPEANIVHLIRLLQ